VVDSSLPFVTRLWFSWACFFSVLFDGGYAARLFAVARGRSLPAAGPEASPAAPVARAASDGLDSALQLLGLFQREGRFVDFVQQEITSFGDADVAAAARVVHEGCRRALASHASIVSVRDEAEGSRVVIEGSQAGALVKLTGNVQGSAPYRGVLRHRGWRVQTLKLPTRVGSEDAHIVAPAEVEL